MLRERAHLVDSLAGRWARSWRLRRGAQPSLPLTPSVHVTRAPERTEAFEQPSDLAGVEPAVAGQAHGLDGRVVVAVPAHRGAQPLDAIEGGDGRLVRRRQVLEGKTAKRTGQALEHLDLETLDVDLAERWL